MNIKKFTLAVIALFIVSNVLTTVWYMITDDANFVPFRREEVNYLGLLLNHLLFVIGFLYLFPFLISERNTKGNAFIFGLVLASIMFIPTGMVVRSIWQVEFNAIFLLNALVHALIGGVIGLTARFIYNYRKV